MFYFFPFILQVVSPSVLVVLVCNAVCFATMLLIHRQKVTEQIRNLREIGFSHLSNYRLKRDFSQFVLITLYFLARMIVPQQRIIPWYDVADFNSSFLLGLVSGIILVIAIYRILFYLLMFDKAGFLIMMAHSFLGSLRWFFLAVIFVILYFTVHFQLVGISYEYSDYAKVPRFFVYCIHIYRTMVGDSVAPAYPQWELALAQEGTLEARKFITLTIIWASWIGCQIVGFFLLLNYLIVLIAEAYE